MSGLVDAASAGEAYRLPGRAGNECEARSVVAALDFVRGGGRTVLARQRVPYPFHITRPFYVDAAHPGLATLYLQSAAGGLYSGDRLALTLAAGGATMTHVTTQAATIVHDSRGHEARQTTRIAVGRDAFCALTSDPFILFPGAALCTDTEVILHPGGRAVLAEGFSVHDPAGLDRPFARLDAATSVRRPDGSLLVSERGRIDGGAFFGATSPLGHYRAVGTMMILGEAEHLPGPATIEGHLDALSCLAGASPLPNAAGLAVRILAVDGGMLARGLDEAFALAFQSLLGARPARRRK